MLTQPPVPQAPTNPLAAVRTWVWLAVALLTVFVAVLASGLLEAALPLVAAHLHAEGKQLNWILSAHLVAVVTLVVLAAALGEMVGHVRVQFVGAVWFLAGWLFSALATSGDAMVAGQVLAGAGTALLLPAAVGYARGHLAPLPRTVVYALFALVYLTGGYLGTYLGRRLIADVDYRTMLLGVLPFGALAVLVAVPMLLRAARLRFEPLLAVVGVLAMPGAFLVSYPLVTAELPHLSTAQAAMLTVGAILLVAAVLVECLRCGYRLGLGAPLVLLLLLVATEHVTAVYIYFQVAVQPENLSVYNLAFGLLLGGVLGAAVSVPAMYFVDGRLVATGGMVITAVSAAAELLLITSSNRSLILYGGCMVISGFGSVLVLAALIGPPASRPVLGSGLVFGLLTLGDLGAAAVLELSAGNSSELGSAADVARLWHHIVTRTEVSCLVILALGAALAPLLTPKGRAYLSGTS